MCSVLYRYNLVDVCAIATEAISLNIYRSKSKLRRKLDEDMVASHMKRRRTPYLNTPTVAVINTALDHVSITAGVKFQADDTSINKKEKKKEAECQTNVAAYTKHSIKVVVNTSTINVKKIFF